MALCNTCWLNADILYHFHNKDNKYYFPDKKFCRWMFQYLTSFYWEGILSMCACSSPSPRLMIHNEWIGSQNERSTRDFLKVFVTVYYLKCISSSLCFDGVSAVEYGKLWCNARIVFISSLYVFSRPFLTSHPVFHCAKKKQCPSTAVQWHVAINRECSATHGHLIDTVSVRATS